MRRRFRTTCSALQVDFGIFFGCDALIDLIWPASRCQVGRRDIFAKVSVQVVVVVALSVAVADLPGVSLSFVVFQLFFYGPKMIALIT